MLAGGGMDLARQGEEISLLYVEDEIEARDMVERLLATKYPELRLLVAENGEAGLRLFRAERPQLVITDIRMPVLDGIRMSAEIKKLRPETIIIAMTAYNDADYLLGALEIGISHYIIKPVKFERLFAVVEEGIATVTLKRQVALRDEALRKSEEKFAKVFHAAPVLIALTTLWEGRCIDVNRDFLEACGLRQHDVVGGTALERCLWKDAEERAAVVRQLVEHNPVRDREVQLSSSRGDLLVGLLSAEVVEIDSQQCLLILVKDITERKKLEEKIQTLNLELEQKVRARTAHLEASIEELERFSYAVSHDLRAPLNRLEGFCTALEEDYAGKLDDEGTFYVSSIAKMSRDVKTIVDALLRLSHVAKADLTVQSVDLSEVALSVVRELQKDECGRAIDFRIEPRVRGAGDPTLLRQALVNLIGNACKFTGKTAHPVVEFGATAVGEDLVYYVRDNGAGFDMRYVGRLFKPFHRLHDDREFPGEGIGLATVQRIVSCHGGRLWAEARPGAGATFFFTLGTGDAVPGDAGGGAGAPSGEKP